MFIFQKKLGASEVLPVLGTASKGTG